MHVVIVDQGRSEQLGNRSHMDSLKCIRCGACLNTCPVYRRSGGYSYGSVIPGPIGSILAPLNQIKQKKDLPFASSLCGSCSDVCPVKIDIHNQLYRWRQEISEQKLFPATKRITLKMAGGILSRSKMFDLTGKAARWSIRNLPRKLIYNRMNAWGMGREMPLAPKESFKQWYKKHGEDQN